jgi:hypothetical protein
MPPAVALSRYLLRVGWEVDFVDVDLTKERPVLTEKFHRADGLWIWARADELGRCTMERFFCTSWLGRVRNEKGRWPLAPQLDDTFLGRSRATEPRALLRQVSDYIADNALSPIRVEEMRDVWRRAMHAPLKINWEERDVHQRSALAASEASRDPLHDLPAAQGGDRLVPTCDRPQSSALHNASVDTYGNVLERSAANSPSAEEQPAPSR